MAGKPQVPEQCSCHEAGGHTCGLAGSQLHGTSRSPSSNSACKCKQKHAYKSRKRTTRTNKMLMLFYEQCSYGFTHATQEASANAAMPMLVALRMRLESVVSKQLLPVVLPFALPQPNASTKQGPLQDMCLTEAKLTSVPRDIAKQHRRGIAVP